MSRTLYWTAESRTWCDSRSHWLSTTDGHTHCQGRCDCDKTHWDAGDVAEAEGKHE